MEYLEEVQKFLRVRGVFRIVMDYVEYSDYLPESKMDKCCQLVSACRCGHWQIVQDLMNSEITSTCKQHRSQWVKANGGRKDLSVDIQEMYIDASISAATGPSPVILEYFKPMIGAKTIVAGLVASYDTEFKSIDIFLSRILPPGAFDYRKTPFGAREEVVAELVGLPVRRVDIELFIKARCYQGHTRGQIYDSIRIATLEKMGKTYDARLIYDAAKGISAVFLSSYRMKIKGTRY